MKNWKIRFSAAALSVLLPISAVLPAGAVVIQPTVDEAYYATLDYYGSLTEGSIVKSYRTNGNSRIMDIGRYDSVENLTDRTEPIVSGDKVTFELGEDAPDNFYFEGKTAQPFLEMPFHISLSYRMNGVEVEAQDMAGQTGVGEIILDITPNPAASEYAKNNFALEATTVVKDTDILSLEAPGAQVQKVGNLDAVLYLVLPGEEQHFTLRIGAEDFSFAGFTFLIQPVTLAQLDMLEDLREAKEELEDSYDAITDSLNIILDSLEGLDSKLLGTAEGLDRLNRARAVLSAGKTQAYDEADKMLSSMTDLSESLSPVADHLQTAKTALRESTQQLQELAGTTETLRPDVQELKISLAAVQADLEALNKVLNDSKKDARTISDLLADLNEDLDELQSDLSDVEDCTEDLSDAVKKLENVQTIGVDYIEVEGHSVAELRQYHGYAETIHDSEGYRMYQAVYGDSAEGFVTFVLQNAEAIAAAIAGETEGSVYEQYAAMLSDAGTVQTLAYLYYNWEEVADQLDEADTFNGMIEDANAGLSQAGETLREIAKPTGRLLDSLQTLTHTARTDLLDNGRELLDAAQSLLDTVCAYDTDALHAHTDAVLTTTGHVLKTTDTVLSQSKALSDTLTGYEPDAQQALEDATTQINAAITLLDDLNAFTTTVETLLKTADPDLDAGTERSLSGLSASLKQFAGSLGATDSLRTANRSIQTLAEDKWEEYTGEKNNALNIDSDAETVSLTSPENQSPNSLQLILRTQEIKVDEEAKAAAEAAQNPPSTLGQRIMRMFRDFAAIFTGD